MPENKKQKQLPLIALILIGIVYWPLALAWCLAYGVFGGIIFKIGATLQDIHRARNKIIDFWRKYPKFSYTEYINKKMGDYYDEHKPDPFNWGYNYGDIRKKMSKDYPNQPFPDGLILSKIAKSLLVLPFRIIVGMFSGPKHLFEKSKLYWSRTFLRTNSMEKYLNILTEEKALQEKHKKHRPISKVGL